MESNEEIFHVKESTILLSQPVRRDRRKPEVQARQPRTRFWCQRNTATVNYFNNYILIFIQ